VTVAGLQRRLRQLERVPEVTTRDAAAAVVKLARDVGAQIGPVTMGKRRRRVQLTAVARFKGAGHNVTATVWGRPTGPWVWVSSGTMPHTIPKAGRRGRGKGRGTRYLKGDRYPHPYGLPVTHPGATGKGAWRRVTTQARTKVPEVYREAIRRAIGG
jgi:hypothetical protein